MNRYRTYFYVKSNLVSALKFSNPSADSPNMRYFRTLAISLIGVIVMSAADSIALKDVKTIFVTPLQGGNPAVADMLHSKLIGALSKIQGISVVEDEENADAILTGSGLIESATSQYGGTSYLIQAGMRLMSKEGGVVLWADNITSRRYARSASSSFADNVAKSLGKLFSERQRKVDATPHTEP